MATWFVAAALPLVVLPLGSYWAPAVLFLAMLAAPALNVALGVEISRATPDLLQAAFTG
ncbi:hypothetical protein [Nonomuraea dietziae]|uniref:hypothetical protein n=1 Tax=Nonomuraea dietziae TaxID=65515 RepID=UPI003429D632